jgi:Signal transduction histidine kinase involved in nitrogen fixation and metabolism regulation
LNRVAEILYNVKTETVQQEKYYELILNCINTGIIVINNEGVVYQKNDEALRLLGLEILTHIKQIAQIDSRLADLLSACRSEDKLQFKITGECGTANLSIRVSGITVRKEYLRIIAFNDINTELDEKEIDSWIRLTRVLTHEIMNSITPITSLSETLLSRLNAQQQYSRDTLQPQPDTISPSTPEDTEILRSGLQAISTTGKGLLDFVENYRRFTRIPTPTPSIFYVRELIDRMVGLTRHQNPDLDIRFQIDIRPDDLMLHADESLISQVLINILKNAVQAIATIPHHEGVITIRAYCDEVEDILIEISNNGPTIPSEIADHIFIPFFTTKDGGSGIGLSISRQIMRISGGSLTLRPGDGTTFVLKLH